MGIESHGIAINREWWNEGYGWKSESLYHTAIITESIDGKTMVTERAVSIKVYLLLQLS